MYSIPLRRALVTDSDLPYPEGVAAAELLKVGAGAKATEPEAIAESKAGVRAVVAGSILSAVYAILATMGVFAADTMRFFRFAKSATAPSTRAFPSPSSASATSSAFRSASP